MIFKKRHGWLIVEMPREKGSITYYTGKRDYKGNFIFSDKRKDASVICSKGYVNKVCKELDKQKDKAILIVVQIA